MVIPSLSSSSSCRSASSSPPPFPSYVCVGTLLICSDDLQELSTRTTWTEAMQARRALLHKRATEPADSFLVPMSTSPSYVAGTVKRWRTDPSYGGSPSNHNHSSQHSKAKSSSSSSSSDEHC